MFRISVRATSFRTNKQFCFFFIFVMLRFESMILYKLLRSLINNLLLMTSLKKKKKTPNGLNTTDLQ